MHLALAYNVGRDHAGWWIPAVVAVAVLALVYLPFRLRHLRRRLDGGLRAPDSGGPAGEA